MNREEIIELLKESLTLDIQTDTSFYGTEYVTFRLLLDGDVISSDTITIAGKD